MDREKIKKVMMEKMGISEDEVMEKMKEMEEKLPEVKEMCTCASCPTYVAEETELGFCHPMVGKSGVITDLAGCICPQCPVTEMMGLENTSFCTMGSEIEQNFM